MPRKMPSCHSEQQFALFLEKVNGSLNVDMGSAFDKAVARLVRRDQPALPAEPDVAAMGRESKDIPAAETNLLMLLGNLACTRSSNESLLMDVLMLLLDAEEPSPAVVSAALGTTRARTDLVRRLSVRKVAEAQARAALEDIVKRFDEAERMREEIRHAGREPMDRACLDRMTEACGDLRRLNRDLRDLLPRLQGAVSRRSPALTADAGG